MQRICPWHPLSFIYKLLLLVQLQCAFPFAICWLVANCDPLSNIMYFASTQKCGDKQHLGLAICDGNRRGVESPLVNIQLSMRCGGRTIFNEWSPFCVTVIVCRERLYTHLTASRAVVGAEMETNTFPAIMAWLSPSSRTKQSASQLWKMKAQVPLFSLDGAKQKQKRYY